MTQTLSRPAQTRSAGPKPAPDDATGPIINGTFPAAQKSLVLLDHDPIRFRPFLEWHYDEVPDRVIYVFWYFSGLLTGKPLDRAVGELDELVRGGVLGGYERLRIQNPLQVMRARHKLGDAIAGNDQMYIISNVQLFGDEVENTVPALLSQAPGAKDRTYAVTVASSEREYVQNVGRAVRQDHWLRYNPNPPTNNSVDKNRRVELLERPVFVEGNPSGEYEPLKIQ